MHTTTEVVSDLSGADLKVLTDAYADMNSCVVNLKTARTASLKKKYYKRGTDDAHEGNFD